MKWPFIEPLSILGEMHATPMGRKRAVQLAKAFGVHPAINLFPESEADFIGKAAQRNLTAKERRERKTTN